MSNFKVQPSRDREYQDCIRSQPCYFHASDCQGDVQAAHMPPKGEGRKGKKASDYFCVPLCMYHHGLHHAGKLSREEIMELQVHGWRLLVRWLDEKGGSNG